VGVLEAVTAASITQHIAVVLVGILLAVLSSIIVGWLWPGMGLPVFITFLVSWGVERINTIALERRHPELVLSPGWKRVKVRYKPLELGEDQYEISLTEFIMGQIALIIFGVPLSLFVAGLIGIIWPAGRWPVFVLVFAVWSAVMLMGILSAINKRME
jgi:ABC-type antimicrobial peptide transport system permease subunit